MQPDRSFIGRQRIPQPVEGSTERPIVADLAQQVLAILKGNSQRATVTNDDVRQALAVVEREWFGGTTR